LLGQEIGAAKEELAIQLYRLELNVVLLRGQMDGAWRHDLHVDRVLVTTLIEGSCDLNAARTRQVCRRTVNEVGG
jgi:hypothetical protein